MKNDIVWRVDYCVGNTYKVKEVIASTAEQAIKRARVKNIEDIRPTARRVEDVKGA